MIDTISDAKMIFELENVTRPDAFKKNVDNLEKKIPDEWKIYISNQSVQVLDDISILRQVADISDQMSLKNSQTSIRKCIDSWPLSQEIIDDYNAACENLRDYRNIVPPNKPCQKSRSIFSVVRIEKGTDFVRI